MKTLFSCNFHTLMPLLADSCCKRVHIYFSHVLTLRFIFAIKGENMQNISNTNSRLSMHILTCSTIRVIISHTFDKT